MASKPVTATPTEETVLSEEERLRADLYSFLATLLASAPDQNTIEQAASLSGDDTEIGQGFQALSRIAASLNARAVEREYTFGSRYFYHGTLLC